MINKATLELLNNKFDEFDKINVVSLGEDIDNNLYFSFNGIWSNSSLKYKKEMLNAISIVQEIFSSGRKKLCLLIQQNNTILLI